jgi:hypothetical protein
MKAWSYMHVQRELVHPAGASLPGSMVKVVETVPPSVETCRLTPKVGTPRRQLNLEEFMDDVKFIE